MAIGIAVAIREWRLKGALETNTLLSC